jgi:hypothetical protein
MWTAEQRERHKVARPKERRGYPTDISDKEWNLVDPLLPGVAGIGPLSKVIASRSDQCAALPGPIGLRLIHTAQRFFFLPNSVLVVLSAHAALRRFPSDDLHRARLIATAQNVFPVSFQTVS